MRLSKPENANFFKKIRIKVARFFNSGTKKFILSKKRADLFETPNDIKKTHENDIITALKERIKLLELSHMRTNDYLENIINTIPANVYWMDTDCVLLGSNLSHAKQAGFSSPADIIGKTDHDFVWKDAAEELIKNNMKVMESGIGVQVEETGILADGSRHVFLTNKVPMYDKDNNAIGLVGISTDITEFKALQTELIKAREIAALAISEKTRAEAAAFVSNAKAAAEEEMRKTVMVLVGDIVHDLKTPITTIKSAAELLERMLPVLLDGINDAKNSGVKIINSFNQEKWDYLSQNTPINSIKNAIVLIDDFITTTLSELAWAHKAHLTQLTKDELIKCSIRRVINKTLEVYPFTDAERLNVHQDLACDFYLMGNSILIMKILFNLIKNAFEQIHFNGGGSLTIYTRRSEDYNLVIIKDTGGGAPPEVTANMFNDYFTTKKNGTGIGLAFCKRMMMSFGGDILSHSVYGESMELILKFPTLESASHT